jgi:hypothetical protein
MTEHDIDRELERVGQDLARRAKRIELDTAFRLRLRHDLIERHHALYAGRTRSRWWMLLVRRLAVVGPSALAVALVAAIALVGLQLSGSNKPQTANAEKLTAAMVRTAPTVTGWSYTVTRHYSNSADSRGFAQQLGKNWRVYIVNIQGRLVPYLYIGRTAHGVPEETSAGPASSDWQWIWAFAQLPVRLADHQASVLPRSRIVDGHTSEGVRYRLRGSNGLQVRATAWVDLSSGQIVSLERQLLRGGKVVEDDWARYRYQVVKS